MHTTPERMTAARFAEAMIGRPWRLRGCGFDAVDCWGLLVLFYRHVHGIEVAQPARSDDTRADFAAGIRALAWDWIECGPEPGATAFVAFEDGMPRHCGVVLDGGLMLHADGTTGRPGQVRATRLPIWARLFPDTRFYRHVSQC